MFGFVMANPKELTAEETDRYRAHYCGICKAIGKTCSQACRLALSYDMAFLSLLLSSLYEPREETKKRGCVLHPARGCRAAESEAIDYAAEMNVALAYYSCRDNWSDDRNAVAWAEAKVLSGKLPEIQEKYPRQCLAMKQCIQELGELEKAGCGNPDEPANCFGKLMASLLLYREDYWADTLRKMGMALGRFIYLADASVDFERDVKRGGYNPFAAFTKTPERERWERYLVLELSDCAEQFERLPLVQDKRLLDKILYSGVWTAYRRKLGKKREETDD